MKLENNRTKSSFSCQKRSEKSIQYSSNQQLPWLDIVSERCPQEYKRRVSMRLRLQSVILVDRAGRGNNMSSEPIETCSMGRDEEDCVDRMFEVHQRISNKDNRGAFHYCRLEVYCRRETAILCTKTIIEIHGAVKFSTL